VNVSRYEIQRSADCNSFVTIGVIPYTNNSVSGKYNFTDLSFPAGAGKICYRIKQLDADGRYLYSPVTSIQQASQNKISILPNPAHSPAIVNVVSPVTQKVTMCVRNLNGTILISRQLVLQKGDNSITLYELDKLSGGSYLLTLNGAEVRAVEQVIKL
jgi:hypothetical protein